MVLYNGIEHYTTGDAQLQVNGSELDVSNLGDSGIDGLSINIKDILDWILIYDPFGPAPGRTFSLEVKGMDAGNRSEAIGGWCAYEDTASGKWQVGLNSRFCDDEIEIIGYDDGTEVYRNTFQVPDVPDTNIWPLILVAILLKSDLHVHGEDGDENDYYDYTYGVAAPGNPTQVNVFNSDTFMATDVRIVTKRNNGTIPAGEVFKPAFVTLQGTGLGSMKVTHESLTQG